MIYAILLNYVRSFKQDWSENFSKFYKSLYFIYYQIVNKNTPIKIYYWLY